MNRKQRRMLQAEADRVAPLLAATCLDYSTTGAKVPVCDDRAVQTLRRAFAAMLRGGAEPVVMSITEDVAGAFPTREAAACVAAALNARPYLAVGLDVTGRATYVMRRLVMPGLDHAQEADLAEVMMLSELAAQMNFGGFPAGVEMGPSC